MEMPSMKSSSKIWFLLTAMFSLITWAKAEVPLADPAAQRPADYFAEPPHLPFNEEIQEEKQEDGWHWKEFRYTSLVFHGEAMRVHAVYAVPDAASPANKVPGIIMTHGVFGAVRGPDYRYWGALTQLVKAGYAVLFFDWYPDFAKNFKPSKPGEVEHFTRFGTLDFYGNDSWLRRGDDFKESLHYQVLMAGRRAISWISVRPEIDATKLGATGASYGGIFSSTLAGIDGRIKAVSSAVFTTDFSKQEDGYNKLPDGWTDLEVARWKNRFDSHVLLANRKVPILYTVGTTDTAFNLTKAMDMFAGFNEPKHLLIGANRGHDYWDFEQTVLFFDSVLKAKMPRTRPADLQIRREGRELVATLPASTVKPAKVRIAFEGQYEKDPDRGADSIPAYNWTWQSADAAPGPNGEYTARWSLPAISPSRPGDTLYDWKTGDNFEPVVAPPAGISPKGLARAFALVTDAAGQVDCTPMTAPVAFEDTPRQSVTGRAPDGAPKFVGAARLTQGPVEVPIDPDAPAGQIRTTLPVALPENNLGRGGYVLWYWRKQAPDLGLKTDGDATPTKQIFTPFKLDLPVNSFVGNPGFAGMAWGGLLNYRIHGHTDTLVAQRTGHGSMQPGAGVSEEIPLMADDDAWHTVTLVMSAPAIGECNVRIGLHNPADEGATVRFRHTKNADSVFQFKFRGKALLTVETTSQPPMPLHTLVGPSALFLD